MNNNEMLVKIAEFFEIVNKVHDTTSVLVKGNVNYMDSIELAIKLKTIWLEEEKNQIIRRGFNVATNDQYPSALEAIAMALGYKTT